MYEATEEVRCWAVGMATACISFFFPIFDFMTGMVVLFFADFLFGIMSAFFHGERWSGKKAKVFLMCCTLFFTLCAMVFVLGHFMHNEKGATQCMSYICYATIYIYGTNILRNIISFVPESNEFGILLRFIYHVITLEVVKKIPMMARWQQSKQEENGKTGES